MERFGDLVVIPARSGSKGVPNKNLRTIGGQSLVQIAVKTCRQAFSRVAVSSDSKEILDQAEELGAVPIARPSYLSGDSSSSDAVMVHALKSLDVSDGVVCLYQCTSPFTSAQDLLTATQMIRADDFDSVFSSTLDHSFIWTTPPDPKPIDHPLNQRPMRQDRLGRIRETGAFYVFKCADFLSNEFRHFGRIGAVIETSPFLIDINTLTDLEHARAINAWISK